MQLAFYIDFCDSTNDLLFHNSKTKLSNFSCIYTFNQNKGRGQDGNIWTSKKYQNIAISFYVKKPPSFDDLFYSFFTIVHLRNFLQKIIPNVFVFIKWSNDILINEKKLCGILIEKKNNDLIIGIGINCNQTDFKNIPNATSLRISCSSKFDLHQIAMELQEYFFNEYKSIEFKYYEEYFDNLIIEYHQYLFRLNQITNFKNKNKKEKILAKITQVDKDGKIHLKLDNGTIQSFRNKEISMIY